MPCGARVEIASVASGVVVVDDHADLSIAVLPILPEAQLGAIVRRILVENGWARGEDGTLTKTVGDAVASLPPGSSTIRVSLTSDEEEVRVEHKGKGATADAAERAAREGAAAKLAAASDAKRRELTRKTADQLLEAAATLRPELDRVANQATREALEQRAAALGAIESIAEGKAPDGSYELTIKVRT